MKSTMEIISEMRAANAEMRESTKPADRQVSPLAALIRQMDAEGKLAFLDAVEAPKKRAKKHRATREQIKRRT